MNEPTKKDGIWIKTNHTYQNVMINQQYTNRQSIVWNDRKMPYNYEDGQNNDYHTRHIVKFRNKLYVIIGRDHVVFDGNTLGQDPKFIVPYSDETTVACELNDYLYWFVTENGNTSKVYRYDGSSFTEIFRQGESSHVCRGIRGITVYNNKILYTQQYNTSASSDNMDWIFYDGNAFTQANYRYAYYSEFEGDFGKVMYPLVIFVLNGNLYYGARKGYTEYGIVKYNGTAWNIVCNLGNYAIKDVCVSNNEAYLLCDNEHDNDYYTRHIIKYTGNSTFVDLGTVSFGDVISELNGNLYIALWDATGDNRVNHFLEGKSPEKVYNPNTVIINKGDAQNGAHLTNMFDTSYMIGNNNNRFVSGFDDCYYFADTSFDWNAPMYYGDGSQWIKFKN